MTTQRTKNARAAFVAKLITGTRKRFADGTQKLTLGGGSIVLTVDAMCAMFQTLLDDRAAVVEAQTVAGVAVDTEDSRMPATIEVVDAYVEYLKVTLGASASAQTDFGLPARKARAPMTAEAKAIAVARRDATRVARGTKGKNQKKAVKGAVNATLVVTPAAATPAGAAPAAAAPPTIPATKPTT